MKKRILTVALVIALLATCFAGTYAYLQDSEAQKNTFTVGTVYITLDEAEVKKDDATGNLVADGTKRTPNEQNYFLFPGMTVTKDPTIHIQANSETAYVAAKITITGELGELTIGENALVGTDGKLNVNALLSGGLLAGTGCTIEQVAGADTWTLYIYVTEAYAKSTTATDIVVFNTLTVPAEWDNDEMKLIDTMEIAVEAYAVQANGFATCEAAMKAAFPAAFN